MADVTITIQDLVANTRSADLIADGDSVNAAQTFAISGAEPTAELIIVLEEEGSGSATVTFNAGDLPPSQRAGLGALAITMANADLRIIPLEGGRFIQDDGTITGTVTTYDVRIAAYRIPRTV